MWYLYASIYVADKQEIQYCDIYVGNTRDTRLWYLTRDYDTLVAS